MDKIALIVGRILFSLMFLFPALNKIMNFQGTQQYMASKGMPATAFLLVCAIVMLLVGFASIAFNFKIKIGASVLIIFLIPATLIFHNDLANQNEFIHFLKNVALLGGLLMLFGANNGEPSFNKVR